MVGIITSNRKQAISFTVLQFTVALFNGTAKGLEAVNSLWAL